MTRPAFVVLIAVAWVALLTIALQAQSEVVDPANKHNLSVTGPGPVKAQTETEVCVFCHTPHNATPAIPLWNQTLPGTNYVPYSSSTLAAAVGLPTGSSKLCLSCHDGTIAIGSTVNKGVIGMTGVGGAGQLTGSAVLGADLTDDHPISFAPVTSSEIVTPPTGSPVKLDGNGQVQCRSCHDPHKQDADSTTMKFLVASNSASALCVTCHNKQYWATNPSTHKTSTKAFTAAQGAHTGYTTVETNGCESCHRPHSGAAPVRNLKGVEEATCSICHGNSGIGRNIDAEYSKTYTHPTYSVTPSVHDAAESPDNGSHPLPETSSATARHAECADCHNAHASYAAAATAPKGSGKVAGVWGIDGNGSKVMPSGIPASVNEYEICYKCHASSANKPQAGGSPAPPYPNRQISQFDKSLQFDPGNASYHPIEAPGRNVSSTVPSLIGGWTTGSIMTCRDCHDNDTGPKAGGSGPAGPHGSNIKHLLIARYDMDTGTNPESAAAYALCYKCHNRSIVNSENNSSWRLHRRHITEENTPCSVCHDAHGVNSADTTRNATLINFDKRFVTARTGGDLYYDGSGTQPLCYLRCHNTTHNGASTD